MRSELTDQERRFLDVVRDCSENNYVPSNDELLSRTGAGSVSALEGIKRSLLRRGFVQNSTAAPLGLDVVETSALAEQWSAIAEVEVPRAVESAESPRDPQQRRALKQKAMQFIWTFQQEHQSSPTYDEIGEAVGRSKESVSRLMKSLKDEGYLRRKENSPRSIQLTPKAYELLSTALDSLRVSQPGIASVYVPLRGRIAAGQPSDTESEDEGGLLLPQEIIGRKSSAQLFLLKVKGPSMTDEGVLDGDVVLVHRVTNVSNGDLVAAMLLEPKGGEPAGTTVKRYELDGDRAWLVPAHPSFQPIDGSSAEIQGKVIALLRWPLSAP